MCGGCACACVCVNVHVCLPFVTYVDTPPDMQASSCISDDACAHRVKWREMGPGCGASAGVDEAAAIHAALFATAALFHRGSEQIDAVGPEVK